MLKFKKFNDTDTYMFPNGAIATPDVIRAQFPAIDRFPHILEVNGDVCQAVLCLSAMRELHNIPANLTEDEAITALEVKVNTPPPTPAPSAEERMAAAMEFSNLLKL